MFFLLTSASFHSGETNYTCSSATIGLGAAACHRDSVLVGLVVVGELKGLSRDEHVPLSLSLARLNSKTSISCDWPIGLNCESVCPDALVVIAVVVVVVLYSQLGAAYKTIKLPP